MGIRYVTIGDDGNEVIYDYQPFGYQGATNQQMELMACVEALKLLATTGAPLDPTKFQKIIIKTDSRYVVDNFDRAKFTWPRAKWLTRDGTPVANTVLWKDLVKRAQSVGRRVEIKWIKGHKSSTHNKAVDKLAKGSARQATKSPLTVQSVRRKKTSKSIERGSVALSGQRLTIRIITDEYLRPQKCWKYKYEVVSKASKHHGNVDLAYSDIMLRAGHTYHVLMNDNSKNPRIMKIYREV